MIKQTPEGQNINQSLVSNQEADETKDEIESENKKDLDELKE